MKAEFVTLMFYHLKGAAAGAAKNKMKKCKDIQFGMPGLLGNLFGEAAGGGGGFGRGLMEEKVRMLLQMDIYFSYH